MGIFNHLFGANKKDKSSTTPELNLEYNVMKNIVLSDCLKYGDATKYVVVENGVYKDLKDEDDAKYRCTITFELEADERNNQYPLEDLLNKFFLHISDFLESENDSQTKNYKLELGGELEHITNAMSIIGKRVFNRDVMDEKGQVRVHLIIE